VSTGDAAIGFLGRLGESLQTLLKMTKSFPDGNFSGRRRLPIGRFAMLGGFTELAPIIAGRGLLLPLDSFAFVPLDVGREPHGPSI
jgi:hypothetical protein